MKVRDIIKKLMGEKGFANAKVAHDIGVAPAALWQQLNGEKENLTINRIMKILDVLNYEIQIVPKGTPLPDNSYRLDVLSISEQQFPVVETEC